MGAGWKTLVCYLFYFCQNCFIKPSPQPPGVLSFPFLSKLFYQTHPPLLPLSLSAMERLVISCKSGYFSDFEKAGFIFWQMAYPGLHKMYADCAICKQYWWDLFFWGFFIFWCCSFPLHSYLTRNIRLQTISDESLAWHCWLAGVSEQQLTIILKLLLWQCKQLTLLLCELYFWSKLFQGALLEGEKKKSWSDAKQNNWPLTSYPFKVYWGQTIQ